LISVAKFYDNSLCLCSRLKLTAAAAPASLHSNSVVMETEKLIPAPELEPGHRGQWLCPGRVGSRVKVIFVQTRYLDPVSDRTTE